MKSWAAGPEAGFARKVWDAKLALQRLVMVATSAIFTSLVFIQVIFRYFLDVPLFGLEEVATYLAVWLYFVGTSYGAHLRNHISANVMDVLIGNERARDFVALVVSLITVVLSVWMTVWAINYLGWSLRTGVSSLELKLPMAWVHSSAVIGLGLMSFYFALEALDRLRAFVAGEPFHAAFQEDKEWSDPPT